jgi:ABC-type iron transport system FetAB permease component
MPVFRFLARPNMISPFWATIIIVTFILIFGVGVPILNRKAPKYISYRWCVIVVVLALLIGVVVDFEVLSNDARKIILVGGLVIAGVYVALRTIEKVLANGWLQHTQIEAKKGDISVKISNNEKGGENGP